MIRTQRKKKPIKDRTTNHCGLSFYKELHPYSLCCSHQYAATAVNSNTAEVFPQYVLNTFITVPQTHLLICCPVTNVIPPSPPISLLALWLFCRDAACYVTSAGAAAGREDTSERTTPTRDCSAQQKRHRGWHEKTKEPAQQYREPAQECKACRIWSGLLFTRQHRLTHHG